MREICIRLDDFSWETTRLLGRMSHLVSVGLDGPGRKDTDAQILAGGDGR